MTVQELLKDTLKSNGYSLTRPRQLVFDILNENNPLTVKELINKTSTQIDRASIYRAMDVFEQANITQRIYTGWKYKVELSDKFQDHHHHLTCQNCGKITPIHNQKLEQFIDELAREESFKANSHQLEIQGLCKNCMEKSKAN